MSEVTFKGLDRHKSEIIKSNHFTFFGEMNNLSFAETHLVLIRVKFIQRKSVSLSVEALLKALTFTRNKKTNYEAFKFFFNFDDVR